MPYKDTNANNLQTLIDFIKEHPGNANSIGYIAAGRVALLGKGHQQDDKDMFGSDDYYKGIISLSIQKKKDKVVKLSFVIEGKMHKYGQVTTQTGGKGELETAIEEAIPDDLANVTADYKWLKAD